jgi:3D (Asp-Asp-Asp) domain-containing protein
MRRKSRAIRRGSAALLAAGMLLAGAQGAFAATVHTAAEGDTFWKLSKTYGVPLDELMAANPNIDPLNIYKGLKLVIPDAGGTVSTIHTAAEGDTFWKLSKTYGVPLDKLMEANPNIDPLNIYKGLKLVIPNAGKGGPDGGAAAMASAFGEAAAASGSASVFAAGKAGTAPAAYKQMFQAKATAYTAAAEENGIWGAVDYFGNPLSIGTVAVDPDVIPLGSKLFITGYDYDGLPKGGMYAIATDTGGAIRGARIDIFVPDSRAEALKFGIQSVTVYVL